MERHVFIRSRRGILLLSAVLAAGCAIAWQISGQWKARAFAGQLQSAVAQQQARTVEKLLERVRTEPHLLNAGKVNAAVAAAGEFLLQQHGRLKDYEAAFAAIPKNVNGHPDAAELAAVAGQLAVVRRALNALAPDLRTENEPAFQALETQWQKFLSQSSAAVNHLLDQWIATAENQGNALDYRAALEKSAAQLAALAGLMEKIGNCESEFANHLMLQTNLLKRSTMVRARLAAGEAELKKIDDGMAGLRRAGTIKEFSRNIDLLASSKFSQSPPVAAAAAMQSLGVGDEAALRILLGVTNADSWAVLHSGAGRFVPEKVLPAEQLILQQLNQDPAISPRHQHYRLWLDSEGTQTLDWITVGPLDNSIGWKQIKAWSPSGFSSLVQFEDRDYGFFDGQYRLSPTQPVYRIEDLGRRNETAAFYSVGLEQVLPGKGGYASPLLAVLDSVKDSRAGSPLFRAWLFLRLMELMECQPGAWGLDFCPAARADELQIKAIVGGQLYRGDWFIASEANANGPKLERFFDSRKSVSYARQAAGLFALARAISQSGLWYAGFVGLDGKPNLVAGSLPEEIWGYDASHGNPALQAIKIGANGSFPAPALPFSPLFTLERSRQEFLTRTGVDPKEPVFRDALPPLFQASNQTQP